MKKLLREVAKELTFYLTSNSNGRLELLQYLRTSKLVAVCEIGSGVPDYRVPCSYWDQVEETTFQTQLQRKGEKKLGDFFVPVSLWLPHAIAHFESSKAKEWGPFFSKIDLDRRRQAWIEEMSFVEFCESENLSAREVSSSSARGKPPIVPTRILYAFLADELAASQILKNETIAYNVRTRLELALKGERLPNEKTIGDHIKDLRKLLLSAPRIEK